MLNEMRKLYLAALSGSDPQSALIKSAPASRPLAKCGQRQEHDCTCGPDTDKDREGVKD